MNKPTRKTIGVLALAGAAVSMTREAPAQQSPADDDQHHDIEEIVVEATALPRSVQQLAQPTSVLRGEELAKKISPSIGETLSQELGVSSTYFGPVASRPVIRGQFGERVMVLSNGLDALDASALSEDHQTAVEGILAERVEIIRGPATLLYGSGAAGGLVNVVDNRIPETPLPKSFLGEFALNGDTAVGERSGAGWVAFGTEDVAVHLDYFRRDTDNIDIPGFAESAILRASEGEDHDDHGADDHGHEEEEAEQRGTVENSDSTTEGGAGSLTWTGDRGFLGVSFSAFDSNYGVPGGHAHEHGEEHGHDDGDMHMDAADAEEEEEENVRIDLEQQRIDVRGGLSFDGPLEGLRFRLANNDYEHTEFEGSEVGTLYENQALDTRLELRHRPLAGFEGAFGVQYKNIDFDAIGDEAFVPASETQQTSIFAFEEFALSDGLTLQGSFRIEEQSIEGSGLAVDYDESAFGAAFGVLWSINDAISVAAHYSVTERHPTATELYADGAHVAVQRFERGSVVQGEGILDKERSNNIDLTLRGNTDRIDWTLTLFRNDANDYIVLNPTAEEEDGFQVFDFNQVDAELYGYEAEARIELIDVGSGHLHTRVFSDYVHGEQEASGAYLPRLTPLRYGLGLHYTMSELEFSVDATAVEDQNKTAANELPTDGYVLWGAEVSYSMPENGLFVFLRGSNLGDEDARQHTSPLKDTVPLPGRALHAGLRFEF